MKLRYFILTYHKSLSWLLLMLYMLFSPGSGLPKFKLYHIPYFDKVIHFGMFSFLIFLFLIDSEKKIIELKQYIFFIVGIVIFAGLSEIIQFYFITGRSGSELDFFADFLGILAGCMFYLLAWKKIKLFFFAKD